MSKLVVVTRPIAQAMPLAERLAARGHEAVIFPLLEIQPLSDPSLLHETLQELDRYAMVAFVSPNAIHAVFSILKVWPANVPIAVIGEGSQRALAQYGVTSDNAKIIKPVNPLQTDSSTLIEAINLDELRAKHVLIIRGETGRELLADALRAAGVEVVQLAAYRRTAPRLDDEKRTQLCRLLDSPSEWIVTSSEALRILIAMVNQLDSDSYVVKLQHKKIFVPHLRIAETAQTLGFKNTTLTGSGDEQLLAALESRE